MLRNSLFASGKLRKSLACVLARNLPRNNSTAPSLDAGTQKEVRHHENHASEWWNQNGTMGALHALNEIRVPFIRDGIVSRGTVKPGYVNTTRVLRGQNILEVGCGGGLLTEQLARLGAQVTGIDLGEKLIEAARDHLNLSSPELATNVVYKMEPVDQHAKSNCECYDAVIVSEVLEHVDDKVALLEASVRTLKPGGSIFITTLNKTIPSWFGGVILSEYVLHLVPKGTHHWDKMISPLDVQRILDTMNCQTVLVNGSTYDFWSNTWRWINNTQMCYALQAVKQPLSESN
ncbi:ubiquinone biosynthesis O-methyltransferase, mitochondrial isoform X2 [Drosophila eugracilis]|uniref:ubiquinone biosynthesis O-methyltransferase, mitochondrial isoform X2 n=1 Tax=Drosophila eugracilis TaxID=29029 RepID=UPI0007E6F1B7|nr:ubiquinone biosynthesis O-methyltransferase, mitochondrial isoform X2 [Drosophila eugracilis]